MRPSRPCVNLLCPRLALLLGFLLLVGLAACGPAPSDHAPSLGGPSELQPVSQHSPSTHHAPVTLPASPSTLASGRAPAGHGEARPAEPLVVPEWIATDLASPDVHVRLHALDRWVQQGRTGSVDPLMLALNDPDERVRTRGLQLIEQDWAQAAEK